MKCRNCGAEVPEGAAVCPHCDSELSFHEKLSDEEQKQEMKKTDDLEKEQKTVGMPKAGQFPVEKKKKRGCLTVIIVVVVILILAAAFSNSDDDKKENSKSENIDSRLQGEEDDDRIDMVKGGTPVMIPDITYEEAYQHFFGNPNWRYFDAEDGSEVVEFSGDCTYYEEAAKANEANSNNASESETTEKKDDDVIDAEFEEK